MTWTRMQMVRVDKPAIRRTQMGAERMMKNALKDMMDRVLEIASENLSVNSVDRGMLLKSGYRQLVAPDTGVVGFSAPYASFIEFGTNPHRPPLKPILDWVHRHQNLIKVKWGPKTRRLHGAWSVDRGPKLLRATQAIEKRTAQLKEEKMVAMRICDHIEKFGQEPKPFFRPALQIAEAEFRSQIKTRWRIFLGEIGNR